ncbi:MAG: TetR/AcrR family transcriptional regulator [Microbacterium enclense]
MDESDAPGLDDRRRRSPEERRSAIIRAAAEAVAELGYANATLTEIAQRSGASKGLLWHYFADRDDLMRQAVSSLSESLRAGLVADIDTRARVPDVVRAVFVRTALFTRTHTVELEALDQIVHNLRAPDGRRRISILDYKAIYADHTALLRRGQREGTIRSGDLRMIVVGYQALIDGLIAYLHAHPDLDPIVHAREVAELFLVGAAEPSEHHPRVGR